jgi:hypothetical protein
MKKLSLKKGLTFGAFLACTLASTNGECAAKLYQFTGTITHVANDTISVKNGAEEFEFNRSQLHAPQSVKEGQQITVFYRLDAKRITPPQQAGEARPNEMAPPSQNDQDNMKGNVIQDDRTFLNAKDHSQQNDSPNG